jgi:DNA-binding phage protein
MRVRSDFCPHCRAYLDTEDAIAAHNVACAESGERQYTRIVGVVARTVEAHRLAQGAGVKAKGAYEL